MQTLIDILENETVVIPGKVLSNGNLDPKVVVAALKFSETAKAELKKLVEIVFHCRFS